MEQYKVYMDSDGNMMPFNIFTELFPSKSMDQPVQQNM